MSRREALLFRFNDAVDLVARFASEKKDRNDRTLIRVITQGKKDGEQIGSALSFLLSYVYVYVSMCVCVCVCVCARARAVRSAVRSRSRFPIDPFVAQSSPRIGSTINRSIGPAHAAHVLFFLFNGPRDYSDRWTTHAASSTFFNVPNRRLR